MMRDSVTVRNSSRDDTPGAAGESRPRVLLVEDHSPLLALIVEQFEEAGFSVVWAGTGEDASWLMNEKPEPEILVTDIRLPGSIDGWQVAERFRAVRPEGPVVYTTGFSDEAGRPVSNSLFLHKPYRATDIIAKVKLLMKQA